MVLREREEGRTLFESPDKEGIHLSQFVVSRALNSTPRHVWRHSEFRVHLSRVEKRRDLTNDANETRATLAKFTGTGSRHFVYLANEPG